ncbi:hypothetical protein [Silvanigrella sp.]|jgi:hypothetical protein|uniref:hypothetical protein n=1 Tax=Silvanigrella sp. TaxID=2024976 RepID=UPI0037C89920
MKNIYNRLSNITINFIANHILIIMFLWIAILSIAILISKHDLKFLIAPSIAFFVPFLIMKFNKHKEEKQNEDFKKIIDESIYENSININENLFKYSDGEFLILDDENLDEWNYHNLQDPEFREFHLEYIDNINQIYKLLCAELKILQDSKLQFYDRKTFIKFRDYKLLVYEYEKYTDKFDFYISLGFYYKLLELLEPENKKLLDSNNMKRVKLNECR